MLPKIPSSHPLHQFFAGVVEHAFYSQLGICSPELVNYLTNLLTEFVHISNIYALKSPSGDTLKNVTEMATKAYVGPDHPADRREWVIHRHIGDYTLYWTGMYPESLQSNPENRLADYCDQGKKSYAIASDLGGPHDLPTAAVLRCLSDHFEDCAYGLTLARRNWQPHSQS